MQSDMDSLNLGLRVSIRSILPWISINISTPILNPREIDVEHTAEKEQLRWDEQKQGIRAIQRGFRLKFLGRPAAAS